MNPDQLKAVFRRVLMGAAAGPLLLTGCGGYNCHPTMTTETIQLVDGGLPQGFSAAGCPTIDFDAGTAVCNVTLECLGREPAGLLAAAASGGRLGDVLARMAHLEAASIVAFRQIATDLRALGAPAELVEAAMTSARDEVRHARAMGALAKRRGATPPRVRVERHTPRSALALAVDNAAEGCAREAFGALVGLYQTEHATDAELRATMAEVANDEVSHAAFSLALKQHLDTRLTGAERAQVEAARERALAELTSDAAAWDALPFRDALGLPDRAALGALATGFRAELARA
jgi:hypothetical protein